METLTNWSVATRSQIEVIESLKSALLSGREAWVEKRDNEHLSLDGKKGCQYPLMTENKGLDNPFNWTMSYGTIHQSEPSHKFKNETEKDLFYNWTVLYSTKEAREEYIKTGKVIKGLNNGMGVCTPVRLKDADKTRKDGYKYKGEKVVFKPKNIEYRVVDVDIKEVYVVVMNGEKIEEEDVLQKLKEGIIALEDL